MSIFWGTRVFRTKKRFKTNDPSYLLELINYQYGYIGWAIGNSRKKEAEKMLADAENNLSKLDESGYKPSWVNAYKSAFFGFKISMYPLKAPFMGPKSMKHAQLSVEIDPANYFGYVQMANVWFYMPAAFGGSKKNALEYLMKAALLIEKEPEQLIENWNYLSLLAFLGQAQMETKAYTQAKNTFDRILKMEPGFSWVKDELFPQLLDKIKNSK